MRFRLPVPGSPGAPRHTFEAPTADLAPVELSDEEYKLAAAGGNLVAEVRAGTNTTDSI